MLRRAQEEGAETKLLLLVELEARSRLSKLLMLQPNLLVKPRRVSQDPAR